MGAEYTKISVRPEFEEYQKWTMQECGALVRSVKRDCPHMVMNIGEYSDVVRCIGDHEAQFKTLDVAGTGKVPALVAAGGIICISKGIARDKLRGASAVTRRGRAVNWATFAARCKSGRRSAGSVSCISIWCGCSFEWALRPG
jgi:hypothetical protein